MPSDVVYLHPNQDKL